VREAEEAFGVRMHNVTWLANSTDALDAAEFKLSKITNKIGYPDHWRSYSNVQITSSFANNIIGLTRIAANKDTALIDTATDKSVFGMLPQEINAYYQPVFNEIVFPAGILRGSFYNPDAPGALNYGAFWRRRVARDLARLRRPGQPVRRAGPSASRGGPRRCARRLRSASTASSRSIATSRCRPATRRCTAMATPPSARTWPTWAASPTRSAPTSRASPTTPRSPPPRRSFPASFDKLTGEQLFFVSWGQNWCTLQTPQALKRQIDVDPHSPGEIRVLGPISQFDEFERVFNCKAGSKYAPKDRCSVW
jgi:putative endopeptidase